MTSPPQPGTIRVLNTPEEVADARAQAEISYRELLLTRRNQHLDPRDAQKWFRPPVSPIDESLDSRDSFSRIVALQPRRK